MIRLVFILILLALSLLTIFSAPTYHLWMVAIMVTEFPWIFLIITAFLVMLGIRTERFQLAGTILGIITFILFLSPIARAYIVAHSLDKQFNLAFGADATLVPKNVKPFRPFKMITGINSKDVPFSTLTYTSSTSQPLTLDFSPSQLSGKRPCIIVVHGGSWAGGDSKQLPELNSILAKRGYNVAALNYRLAPQSIAPAPIEDVQEAMRYLSAHSGDLNIDTSNFVLLGRSAGAQIALLAAYTLHDARIKGVIDFYGPADMVWGYSVPSNPLIMDSRKVMSDYLGGTYDKVPQNFVNASPLFFVTKESPPTLIFHGPNDPLVAYEHSRRLNEKLQQNGIKHLFVTLPWATHGFDYTLNGPGGQISTYTVLRFLKGIIK